MAGSRIGLKQNPSYAIITLNPPNRLADVHAIDLSGNRLTYVTSDISRMRSLTKLDIRNQKTEIDMMRAIVTPLSDACLTALHNLVKSIDVKY